MVYRGKIPSKLLNPYYTPGRFLDTRISTRDVLRYSMYHKPSKPGSTLKGDPKGKGFATV